MENNYNIKTIKENGTDFEDLWFSSSSDEILDNPEDEGGKPFSGLAYELYSNGNIIYFTQYKDGLAHGLTREFFENGNKKSDKNYRYGQLQGVSINWFEDGKKKSEQHYEHSILISEKKWDERGILKHQYKIDKNSPHFEILETRRETHNNLGRE
ncbi:toxin-antitoxin system YwqK family antitoxin [Bacillus atrophaeus]|uniref:toxin-antitoxin system YwqK family antitoxin n=1 Tax=Bacillus atrophaeus TaxID=1452 RepID=UPI002282D68B|nr:toxin-antitoxin system YwqK family antitoxin [Bacillus atrophaeus]MCY8498305.1 toxin-antitoxin system YwqK family antitoxin [Bacillus atrophaeus]MCY8811979.1 toxin-antitoxin system YwqK family antitoxin [Bacillus atrophaeus]MCY8820912.1 toxin-antitoxin system YwqK family antitoxin [Bacillus atrophaeus]MCY8827883.1 toxin-antitoxin system YwqK family antitoxin [Bacillus atrophaeus]MCY8831936.1 toxin-antitoxin system YwqK family antitoxin [Bacillus atrophaeus]